MVVKKSKFSENLKKLVLETFSEQTIDLNDFKEDKPASKKESIEEKCFKFLKKNYDFVIHNGMINLTIEEFKNMNFEELENLNHKDKIKKELMHYLEKLSWPFTCRAFAACNKDESTAYIIFFLSDVCYALSFRSMRDVKENLTKIKEGRNKRTNLKYLFVQDIKTEEEFDIETITIKRKYARLDNPTPDGRAYTIVKGNDDKERLLEEEAIEYFKNLGYHALYADDDIFLETINKYGEKKFNKKIMLNLLRDKLNKIKQTKEYPSHVGMAEYKLVEYTKEMKEKDSKLIKNYLEGKNDYFDKFIFLPFKELRAKINFRGLGLPDLFIWNPQKIDDFFFCEVKSQNDSLSHFQQNWINANKNKIKIKILKIDNENDETKAKVFSLP